MDKKSTVIGILLIGLAVGLMFFNAKNASEQPVPAETTVRTAALAPVQPAPVPAKAPGAFSGEKKIWTLENDRIALRLSSFGGGIESVELKDFEKTREDDSPVVFNDGSSVPALTLASAPATLGGKPEPWAVVFALESDVTDEAAKTRTVTLVGSDAVRTVRRVYALSLDGEGEGAVDPYFVRHSVEIVPAAGVSAVPAGDLYVSTGMLPPTNGDKANVFLNASWYDGDDYDKIGTSHFVSSNGFFGLGSHTAQPSVGG